MPDGLWKGDGHRHDHASPEALPRSKATADPEKNEGRPNGPPFLLLQELRRLGAATSPSGTATRAATTTSTARSGRTRRVDVDFRRARLVQPAAKDKPRNDRQKDDHQNRPHGARPA